MALEKNYIIYTAEDIQKYLDGKLNATEMYAMERAALDDDFLAEAIEGYAGVPQKDRELQLAYLKDHFSKNETAQLIPLQPASRFSAWKIAAAILVICSLAGLTYIINTQQSHQEKPIAVISKKADSVNRAVGAPVIPDPDTIHAAENSIAKNEPQKITNPSAIVPEKQLQQADSTFIYRPGRVDKSVAKQEPGGGYTDADSLKTGSGLIASNNAVATENPNKPLQYKSNKFTNPQPDNGKGFLNNNSTPAIMRKYAAQIVAPDGTPLPFANISITKDNIGTYADAKGNFRLVSADSILNVEIKSAGYLTRNYTLISGMPQNKITLAEDELALKEKTEVTGNADAFARSKKRRAILIPDSVINVEPEDGWSNYDTYITNNLAVSNYILKRKIHGEVEVSFDVQSNGAITNVKVDKSLCDDCDEAALRVIKEGPRWKVKNGSQTTGKVKVKF